jgi:alkanesulfonate monooxygenase SsuD/methylene tetrahydromethanopterin reductase-like flavin-dependent oxidoreductase (luciferase family)
VRYNLMFPMRAVKHWNRWCEGASIADIARLVEEAGFDAFSMSEHPYPTRSGWPMAAITPSTPSCR